MPYSPISYFMSFTIEMNIVTRQRMYKIVETLYKRLIFIIGLAGKWKWKTYRLKMELRMMVKKQNMRSKSGFWLSRPDTSSAENLNIPKSRKTKTNSII